MIATAASVVAPSGLDSSLATSCPVAMAERKVDLAIAKQKYLSLVQEADQDQTRSDRGRGDCKWGEVVGVGEVDGKQRSVGHYRREQLNGSP